MLVKQMVSMLMAKLRSGKELSSRALTMQWLRLGGPVDRAAEEGLAINIESGELHLTNAALYDPCKLASSVTVQSLADCAMSVTEASATMPQKRVVKWQWTGEAWWWRRTWLAGARC